MPTQITPAEFEVMDILWAEAPLAASDIAERLTSKTNWNVKTVKTLLSRLVEKRVLTHEQDGRRYLYRPAVSRKTYAQNATSHFADRLFGGRAALLVAHLAEAQGLTDEDIDELEALVEDLKRDHT